ncbi:MAG: hypothetical protein E7638_05555 [Ruminococcaceae bacterium]|nr:hypothetical protein [Oscillospiraceae bacterium]
MNMDKEISGGGAQLLSPEEGAKKRVRWSVVGICFAVSACIMFLLYACLKVWPFGENAVLVLDLNAQYVYYFEKLRNILTEGDSILYAFERNLGGEFMGIFAYYLSSPFSLLVALFPKEMMTEAIYAIMVLKCGFCALTFGYFLEKTRRLSPFATVMFSLMYSLSAYAVVMQHNLMWTDNLIALPLLVLGVDAIIKEGRYRMFTLSLIYCVMSNFYIGYMSCIFVFIYFFLRYFMLSEEERNPMGHSFHFPRALVRVGIFSVIALAVSAIIILPTYYSLSFGKMEFSEHTKDWAQIFDFLDILTKTFFGSYDTVRPEGMPFIYCGMLMPILLPLYFFNSDFPKRKKLGYMLLLLVFIVSFNLNQFDFIWHGGQRPNWLNTRYAYMFVFFAIVLTVDALAHLKSVGVKKAAFSAGLWAVLLLILQKFEYEHLPDFKAVWASLGFLAIYAALVPWVKGNGKRVGEVILSIVVCCEMVLNGVVMVYALDEDVSFTTRKSYREMVDEYSRAVDTIEDDSFYRAEKLVHRKKNDNFAVDLNGLSNSTSTLNAKVVKLLKQFGYTSKSHWSMYIGANPVTDALFGIKYVIADESARKDVMDYIHDMYEWERSTEDHLDIYRNPYALSIAYEVGDDILDYDLPPVPDPDNPEAMVDEDYIAPFEYMNDVLTAMTGEKTEVFIKNTTEEMSYSGVKIKHVVGHTGYEVSNSTNPQLTYTLTVESDKPLYLYFPSEYPREVTLKLNGQSLGSYFENETHAILELGSFEVGEVLEITLELEDKNLYISNDCRFFWYFDEDAFHRAMAQLHEGNMAAYSDSDDEIYGTITVRDADSVVFTTIPYDEGWRIYADGERCETMAVLDGTLLAFDCPVGEHEIRMVYRPKAVTLGLAISVAGIAVFAGIWALDEAMKRRRAKAE